MTFDIVLEDGAIMPKKAHLADSCFDIYSNEDKLILPYEVARVKTGIHIAFPAGWGGKIRPRSSWFLKGYDIDGTIDSGYTGEILVIIHNHSARQLHIFEHERIAQLKVEKIHEVEFNVVDSLEETERGNGGFGSSGTV